MEFSTASILQILLMVAALMVAVIGHEIMHGYAAYRYGDATAKYAGRLTLNPIPHVDVLGTIIVPLLLFVMQAPFLFGWAKPVPVNSRTVYENGGYGGLMVVALAGIAYNFVLAVVSSLLIKNGIDSGVFAYLLLQLVIYNVVLGVFNLMPIPGLDGAHALSYLFRIAGAHGPADLLDRLTPYGMIVLVIVLATPLSQPIFGLMRTVILGLLR